MILDLIIVVNVGGAKKENGLLMYNVECLDIGLTTRCNAGCPQCARTDPSKAKAWDWLKMEELTLDDIKTIAPIELVKQLKRVSLCGGYGDPLIARDVQSIIQYFLENNNKLEIYIATNGGMKKPESWWHDLGNLLKGRKSMVTFGIDGINQEQHSRYRIHTDIDVVFRNVEILQMYKVPCRWQYLIFDYNKDNLETAREMSKKKRFVEFLPITTTRAPVGEHGPPDTDYYYAQNPDRESFNLRRGLEYDYIDCFIKKDKEVHINASGVVVPCCYTDWLFHAYRYAEPLIEMDGYDSSHWNVIDIHNMYVNRQISRETLFDDFNAKIHGLPAVLKNPWWDEFFDMSANFKINKCNDICGKCK
jgi:MoaA/NifB/PqqE/SkfB family radical SAM enzyme